MNPEQVLLLTMIDNGMEINPGTLQSLKDSIEDNNIYFFDKDGEPSGFVTWYFDNEDLIINNLCIFKSGINKLYELRKFFHEKYPSLNKVRWYDEKRHKVFEYTLERIKYEDNIS